MISCPRCYDPITDDESHRGWKNCQCTRQELAELIRELRDRCQHLDHTSTLAKERADRLAMELAAREGR